MPWSNAPLVVFHGCDHLSAAAIGTVTPPFAHGINLSVGAKLTDFGRGFYTTTHLKQAKSWANVRCQALNQCRGVPVGPSVLRFELDRNLLAHLEAACFVTEATNTDFWDLVNYCRSGYSPHRPVSAHQKVAGDYDVVYGLVSIWPQQFVIKDCDQVSFHTSRAIGIMPAPTIEAWQPPGILFNI